MEPEEASASADTNCSDVDESVIVAVCAVTPR